MKKYVLRNKGTAAPTPDVIRRRSRKRCDVCSSPYYRSNRIRVWTTINIGHRGGWFKEDLKLCLKCFSTKKAQRVVTLASIHVTVADKPSGAA